MSNEMTAEEAQEFFAELFGGKHHIPHPGVHTTEAGYARWVNVYGEAATYDLDLLTRFVFLCHDRCYRGVVKSSGPRMIMLCITKRLQRETVMEGHPTIEGALAKWRARHPPETVAMNDQMNPAEVARQDVIRGRGPFDPSACEMVADPPVMHVKRNSSWCLCGDNVGLIPGGPGGCSTTTLAAFVASTDACPRCVHVARNGDQWEGPHLPLVAQADAPQGCVT